MGLPKSIQAIVSLAKKQLKADREGRLRLGIRQSIWKLGPQVCKGERAVQGIGLKRRFHLARCCSQRVLSIWQMEYPDDDIPQRALKLADDYMKGDVKFKTAARWWETMGGDLRWYREEQPENSPTIAAGYAASGVLYVALFDELYDPQSIDPNLDDLDVDFSNWDSSYYSAESYALTNGSTEQKTRMLRREFWSWYLDVAVPAAWNSQPHA